MGSRGDAERGGEQLIPEPRQKPSGYNYFRTLEVLAQYARTREQAWRAKAHPLMTCSTGVKEERLYCSSVLHQVVSYMC